MEDITKYKYLFLDRDGVINVERPNDYVKNIAEFVFIDGVLDAIAMLSKEFEYIYIVTNQRGVGRGIMSQAQLQEIHNHMISKIEKAGGKIDRIYCCTDTNGTSINRKPNIGMGFLAQQDFPTIDFSKSIMVGNSRSDIDFANKLGMISVLTGNKYDKNNKIYQIIDAYWENLYNFAYNFHKAINTK